ncbi:dnaJ homolog subfamily C member 21-like [Montipora capricornis]|uniref:dnaJ homolog subfamily C member 21-like n=1 Tax=Montipora capricornis TaxID=246305 RepID=UPI0035F167AC
MPRCCYEVLELERDAGNDEIKKSYRRLALKWHPDKNGNCEESTRIFTEIQQAYEVLIDPQERAWYDKHREKIIRGGDDYVDNSINLMKYFSASVYCGYEDDEHGFYAIYRNVFRIIAQEDAEFATAEDLEMPEFGTSLSDYDEVVQPFYAHWQSYSTVKSYVWLDRYDLREAPNRRVQRLMEKDNKKIRDGAKKERNEEVRALVKFVRKRDKRVKVYLQLLKEKDEERKRLTERKRLDALREREKMFEEYKEESWASLSGLDEDLAEMNVHLDSVFGKDGDVSDSQSEEFEEEQFYCVACDKVFKTDKALHNHEKSRKHKSNVEAIKREMADDQEKNFMTEPNELLAEADYLNKGRYSVDENSEEFVSVGELDLTDSVDLSTMRIKGNNRYKVRVLHERGRALSGIGETELQGNLSGEESQGTDNKENEVEERNSQKEEIKKENEENENSLTESKFHERKQDKTNKDRNPRKTEHTSDPGERVAKSTATNQTAAVTNSFKCNVCQALFPTRNKMFQHIKEQGHALKLDAKNDGHESLRRGKNKGKKKR